MEDKTFFHIDSGQIKGKAQRTDEGYISADSVLTRVGVFNYLNTDGSTRRELRLPEEVFKEDSMNTLKMVPLTHGHPSVGLLDSSNVKNFQVGHVGETIKQDETDLMGKILVTDGTTIKSIDSGKKDVSCGYTCNLDFTPGEWQGERYDAIQRNIKYNHVAVGIAQGRAGNAKINLDENNAVSVQIKKEEAQIMPDLKKVKLKGVEYEAEASVITALTQHKERIDELESELKSSQEEKSKIEAKFDSLQDELKEAKKVDILPLVKQRVKLVETAKANLDEKEHEKLDSMSDLEIKKAVILSKQPKATLDEKDSVYIDARYDAVLEMESKEEEIKAPKFEEKKEKMDSADDARSKYIASLQDAWRGE